MPAVSVALAGLKGGAAREIGSITSTKQMQPRPEWHAQGTSSKKMRPRPEWHAGVDEYDEVMLSQMKAR